MEFANKKRLKKALIFYGIVATLLLIRVGYIQILCHDELSAGAISQYQINIEGLDTRGMILDRNYMPLTGGTTEYYYFIDKDK